MKAPKTVRIVAGIVGVAILTGLVGSATAVGITNTYQFLSDQSSVNLSGGFVGISENFSIQGSFQMTVDYEARTASFDQVNATFTPDSVYLSKYDMGTLFYMTELVGRMPIDFMPGPPLIIFQGRTHEIGGTDSIFCLIDIDGSLQLTGRFWDGYVDGFQYDLDALAIPEPTTLLPGDANHDGLVSADDYSSIQAHFGDSGEAGILGDANGTGTVSADDYASVQSYFGNTGGMGIGSGTVPEPATLSLLVIGCVAMLTKRRRT